MASSSGPGDDEFDFADGGDDQDNDFDWDELDEPEQPPAAAAAKAPPQPAAPPPLAIADPQPTQVTPKVGPIPFKADPPPAPAAPTIVGALSVEAPTAAAPPAVPPAPKLPALGGAAAAPAAPTAGPPAAVPGPMHSVQQPSTAAPAAARPAGSGPVKTSGPPARQYAAPPGASPGSTPPAAPTPAALTGASPQAKPSPAAAGVPQQAQQSAAAAVAPGRQPEPAHAAVGGPGPTAAAAGSVTPTPPARAPQAAAAAAPSNAAMAPPAAAAAAAAHPGLPAPGVAAASPAAQPGSATAAAAKQPASGATPPAAEAAAAAVQAPPAAAAGPATGQRLPAAAGEGAGGAAWGGWGLGGLTNKLQQVALGAAKDLQELTASVQQAVAEVVAADDVSEAEQLSSYQERPSKPSHASAASAAPPAAVTVSRTDSTPHMPAPAAAADPAAAQGAAAAAAAAVGGVGAEDAKRQQVLTRLQGEDRQLESGLKAIDEQVDLLAASAAKALGSLWGGFSTVAKQSLTVGAALTAKVEAAAKEVAKELVVGLEEGAHAVATPGTGLSLREAAGQLAARAERTLESVGRGAASLLDPQFSRTGSGGSGQGRIGRSPSDWAATFDSCFELYGGAQAAEELEQLSSECAHICNRARAKLHQEARQQIDATLTKLAPAFDMRSSQQLQQQAAAAAAAAASSSMDDEQAAHMQEAIDSLYLPVRALCSKGKYKASQLQQEAAETAPDAAAADAKAAAAAAGSSTEQTQTGTEIQPEADSKQEGDAAGMDDRQQGGSSGGGAKSNQLEQLLQRLLGGLRSAAVKSLAEVSAGQVILLLSLGRSLAALPRYGKPLDDGLEWPTEPEAVAHIMHRQAQAMLADVQALTQVFTAAAPAMLKALQEAAAAGELLSSEAAAQQARAAAAEVEADCGTALAHVKDGFGKLLYVVLLASLHRAGLQHHQQQQSPKAAGSHDSALQAAAASAAQPAAQLAVQPPAQPAASQPATGDEGK